MAGTNSPSDISRRDVLKAGALLVAGVTGTAAEGAPGAENVKRSTKDAVESLRREFPQFKLSKDAQQCLEDKLIDPECDPTINDEVRVYRNKRQLDARNQQLDARNQQLDARNQQLEIVEKANQGIEIVMGLIQLGMYVDYGKVPNPQANYMEKVQQNKNTPSEIQQLFTDILERHQKGLPLPYNPYGQKLLGYAKSYLDSSMKLQEKITDPRFKTGIAEFTNNALSMFSGYSNTKGVQKVG